MYKHVVGLEKICLIDSKAFFDWHASIVMNSFDSCLCVFLRYRTNDCKQNAVEQYFIFLFPIEYCDICVAAGF